MMPGMAKKVIMRCVGVSLLADGRQQVQMTKAPAKETGKAANGATVVNPNDAGLTFIAEAGESYIVATEYPVAIG